MARPKRDNPALFTGGELADATGISLRNVQFLRDKRLGPFASKDQAGGLYEEDTLAEVAMIGGCMGAGYALSLSAALVSAFLSEHPNHPAARFCSVDRFHSGVAFQGAGWFERHVILREDLNNQNYALTSGHDEDSTLVVADRENVLTGTRGKPRLKMSVEAGVDPEGPFALGRMHDLVRGADSRFEAFSDTVTWQETVDGSIRESAATIAAQIAFQRAAKDAVALVTVNLSLSIRRAFDRVYEARKAKGGPLWSRTLP